MRLSQNRNILEQFFVFFGQDGRETPGKRSPVWNDGTQLFEWNFNREIVQRISKGLEAHNITPYIVTPEDADVFLTERVRRINAHVAKSKEPCLLISIHANAGGGTGWEAWTSPGQTKSDEYVCDFYRAAHDTLPKHFPIRAGAHDNLTVKESKFYVLMHTKCPAILTENLFMDTEIDCRFLMSEKGTEAITTLLLYH